MAASFPPFMVFQEKHNSSLHRGASQPQMSRGHHPVLIRSSLWLRIRSSSSKERGREEEGERVLGSWDFSCEELKKTRRLVFQDEDGSCGWQCQCTLLNGVTFNLQTYLGTDSLLMLVQLNQYKTYQDILRLFAILHTHIIPTIVSWIGNCGFANRISDSRIVDVYPLKEPNMYGIANCEPRNQQQIR